MNDMNIFILIKFDVEHCRMKKAYKYWAIDMDYWIFFNLHRGWPFLHTGIGARGGE